MKALREFKRMLVQTFREWQSDAAPTHAAALSFYTIFSIAPLLIIAIAIAAITFGEEASRGQIVNQIDQLVGRDSAKAIEELLLKSNHHGRGVLPMIIGTATLIAGATAVFGQLKAAMNAIWNVQADPKRRGIWVWMRNQVLSFALVLAVGFLLLVSLLASASIAALTATYRGPTTEDSILLTILDGTVSLGLITVLFALIFKFLPDTRVSWRDVWLGAFFTAALFDIGKMMIGLYLGHSAVSSTYGAAGSLIVLLLWVYYACQIFFFGAEFTQVYAHRHGSRES